MTLSRNPRISYYFFFAFAMQPMAGQSVDCRNAKTRVEQLICTTPWLTDMDKDLGQAYAKAPASGRVTGEVEYRRSREACPNAECVLRVEKQRISYLLGLSDRPSPTGRPDSTGPATGPAPLFGGQIGTRSSQKGKESATLSFNGIDPSGKVQQSVLSASPNATHAALVRNLDASRPSAQELAAFLRDGGLNAR
jgi:hypothetical protein